MRLQKGNIVYLKSPLYKKTKKPINGHVYGVDWINGYAGPFYYHGPQFNRMMARLPSGCSILSEEEYYSTDEGMRKLKEREVLLNRKTEEMAETESAMIAEASVEIGRLESRYVLLEQMGLLNPTPKLRDDIKLSSRVKVKGSSEQMKQLAARKRVLKHCAQFDWDRDRFGEGKNSIKDEWIAFTREVVNKIIDEKGDIMASKQPRIIGDTGGVDREISLLYGS